MKYHRTTALEIAYRGHDRLVRDISEGKYTVERVARGHYRFTKLDGTEYETQVFINPADREEFRVICTCPFSGEGFENDYCKHGIEAKNWEDWEEVWKPDEVLDVRAVIQDFFKREREAENAHYDAMAQEWEESQTYQRIGADMQRRYPAHTHEREDAIFDAIL